jgi:hypothetical protein
MKRCALLLIMLIFTACSPSPSAEVPTLLVLATDGPSPTATRLPTETPTSTDTPLPSDTPSPGLNLPPDPASCDINPFWVQVEPLVQEYLDTLDVAGSTSRIAIAPILLELKRVQREFDAVPPLSCDPYLDHLLSFGIDQAFEAFSAFSADSDLLMTVHFQLAGESFYAASYRLQQYGIFTAIDLSLIGFEWGVVVEEPTMTAMAIRYFNTVTPTFTPSPTATAAPTLTPSITPSPTASSTPLPRDQQIVCVSAWWPTASGHVAAFRDTLRTYGTPGVTRVGVRNALAGIRDYFDGTVTPDCALQISRMISQAMGRTVGVFSSSSFDAAQFTAPAAYFQAAALTLSDLGITDSGVQTLLGFTVDWQLEPPDAETLRQIALETQ